MSELEKNNLGRKETLVIIGLILGVIASIFDLPGKIVSAIQVINNLRATATVTSFTPTALATQTAIPTNKCQLPLQVQGGVYHTIQVVVHNIPYGFYVVYISLDGGAGCEWYSAWSMEGQDYIDKQDNVTYSKGIQILVQPNIPLNQDLIGDLYVDGEHVIRSIKFGTDGFSYP